jgi:hypothetical protein
MIPRPHNNKINDPVKVFGINFYDIAYSGASLLGVIVVLGFINIYTAFMGPLTFLAVMIFYGGILFALKYTNKQNHPQFLTSVINFRFFQPKKIVFYRPEPGKKLL